MAEGYIYILFNPAFHKDQYKIGKTTKLPEIRAQEISIGTGVPRAFEVLYEERVVDCDRAERLVHQKLSSHRRSRSREFFEVQLKDAIRIVSEVATDVGRISTVKHSDAAEDKPAADTEAHLDDIAISPGARQKRISARMTKKASVSFEDHAAYTDESRREILVDLRKAILGLDERLSDGETCTAGNRIAYKIPGGKTFLEVKVQRGAIVLHLIDGGVSDSGDLAEAIPESHGWRHLKLRIRITTTQEGKQALPFIEGAFKARDAAV